MYSRQHRKVQNFSITIKKEIIKINKDSNETVETISYKKNSLVVQDLRRVCYQILLIL